MRPAIGDWRWQDRLWTAGWIVVIVTVLFAVIFVVPWRSIASQGMPEVNVTIGAEEAASLRDAADPAMKDQGYWPSRFVDRGWALAQADGGAQPLILWAYCSTPQLPETCTQAAATSDKPYVLTSSSYSWAIGVAGSGHKYRAHRDMKLIGYITPRDPGLGLHCLPRETLYTSSRAELNMVTSLLSDPLPAGELREVIIPNQKVPWRCTVKQQG